MRKIILLLLLSSTLCFGQFWDNYFDVAPFSLAADSVGSITLSDSVYVQGQGWDFWKLLTQSSNDTALITGDDKIAENTVQFCLACESWWTHQTAIRFMIASTGQDSAISDWVTVQNWEGAITLDVISDTISTKVDYSNSILHGN